MLSIIPRDLVTAKIQDWLEFLPIITDCDEFYEEGQVVDFLDKKIQLVRFDAVSGSYEIDKLARAINRKANVVPVLISAILEQHNAIHNLGINIYDAIKDYQDVTLISYPLKLEHMETDDKSRYIEGKLFKNMNGVYHTLAIDVHRWDMSARLSVLIGIYSYVPKKGN